MAIRSGPPGIAMSCESYSTLNVDFRPCSPDSFKRVYMAGELHMKPSP